ncbi:hypothetical protein HK100_003337 [Physocladia obscura]|uniref:DUF676 domain-containing protein n=1 Tax=Physocladia obscura TaxID=109957 RepID=A0AAD5XEN7_9FUNG|nr:hypothetical protein HK100_003337 [Physocladia obscura]
MEYIGAAILRREPSTAVLIPTCNHGRTELGIETQATSVVAEIRNWVRDYSPQSPSDINLRLSLIGHSLGGLILRHVAKMLIQAPILPFCNIRMGHFITIATPHLGSSWFSSLPPAIVASAVGKTGSELVLRDAFVSDSGRVDADHQDSQDPLLHRMARESDWMNALAAFQSRTCYACTRYDLSVGIETAFFWPQNLLKDGNNVSGLLQSVIALFCCLPVLRGFLLTDAQKQRLQPQLLDVSELHCDLEDSSFNFADGGHDGHNSRIRSMIKSLNLLQWTRIAIFSTRPIFGHIDCIVKSKFWCEAYGESVIRDVVERVLI